VNKIYIMLIFLLISGFIFADTSGENGFQMLRIVSGADIAAQGGTGSLYTRSAFGFLQNAASNLVTRNQVISMTQNYWIFDTTLNSLAYTNRSGRTSIAFGYRYLDYGKIDNRDETGAVIGEFHPMDLSVSANFAYRVTPDHYAGITISGIYEKIDTSSSLGASFDLGYIYLTNFRNMKITAAVKNLGITSKMDEESIDLPITAEISLVDNFQLGRILILTEVKAIKYIDDDRTRAVLGLTFRPAEKLDIRFGYKENYAAEDISLGIGINLKKICIDYTYIPFQYEINDVHMIGINYKF
jgi:hypothetical protein